MRAALLRSRLHELALAGRLLFPPAFLKRGTLGLLLLNPPDNGVHIAP